MKYASFGSVSSGTLRTKDLLSAFADTLDSLLKVQPRSFKRRTYRNLVNKAHHIDVDSDLDSARDIEEELYNALSEFAPPYAYFGTLDGDEADFGFWLSELPDSFEALKVNDTSEVPRGYRGGVLHVSDHGNPTLYVANGRGKLKEIWALV